PAHRGRVPQALAQQRVGDVHAADAHTALRESDRVALAGPDAALQRALARSGIQQIEQRRVVGRPAQSRRLALPPSRIDPTVIRLPVTLGVFLHPDPQVTHSQTHAPAVYFVPMPGAVEIVHLAYASFPADTRVKREALAALATGRRVAVVVLRADRQLAEEESGALTVLRLPGRKSRRGPLAYLGEYAAFTWRCRRLLAHDPRFAAVRVVHVHTLPDFLVWAAAPAQRRGARLILDLHEIFPEFTASRYSGVVGRLGSALARRIALWARRRADLTITVNRPIDDLLARPDIGRPERRLIVHNSPDPQDFGPPRPPPSPPARSTIELIYHGTLTPLYGLDVAIRGVLPVLAGRLPSYAQYVPENAAWYWTPNDATDLARAIGEFAAATPAQRLARARRAQEGLATIAWPGERERLLAAYRELLAAPPPPPPPPPPKPPPPRRARGLGARPAPAAPPPPALPPRERAAWGRGEMPGEA